jgi:hypothetical protein
MRLIRTILLLTGAAVLMPSPPDSASTASEPAAAVSTIAVISSATSAFADLASFCVRQPVVCETAGYVAGRLEAKAKYSARLIYEWASDATADPALPQGTQEAIKADMLKTGTAVRLADSQTPQGRQAAAGPSENQSTLRLEDLLPEWRGPSGQAQKQG